MTNENEINLLNEIFLAPSNKMKAEEPTENTETAVCRVGCSGSCHSFA